MTAATHYIPCAQLNGQWSTHYDREPFAVALAMLDARMYGRERRPGVWFGCIATQAGYIGARWADVYAQR